MLETVGVVAHYPRPTLSDLVSQRPRAEKHRPMTAPSLRYRTGRVCLIIRDPRPPSDLVPHTPCYSNAASLTCGRRPDSR
jgi:hypothetical protein